MALGTLPPVAQQGADPPAFSLGVTRDGGVSTIAVSGELDLATTPPFGLAVAEALDSGDLVIDLAACTFMDSSGVRSLNAAMRSASERGRALRVRGEIQPGVAQVLELTGMLALLPVEEPR